MSSRKEQKERLRREREEREAAAKAAERRRRLIGYGAGGLLAAIAIALAVVLLASGGGGGDEGKAGESSTVLPEGGSVPEQEVTELRTAAKQAGCDVQNVKVASREHTGDLAEPITYGTKPPTSGSHFQVPAEDGAYEEAPDPKALVHTLEHGRVIIWFKKNLPKDARADLRALFDEDPYQMVITPDTTGMPYQVAATAWSRDPVPNGTGRLLGCRRFSGNVFDALRAFKDEYRGDGPEAVP